MSWKKNMEEMRREKERNFRKGVRSTTNSSSHPKVCGDFTAAAPSGYPRAA